MRGYIVRAKKIHYYKCNTIGCNCNKNAAQLHKTFLEEVKLLTVEEKYSEILKDQLKATFHQLNESKKDNSLLLQPRLEDINKKIERIQERFVLEEIDKELYQTFIHKYKAEKEEIKKQIEKSGFKVSNLYKYIDYSVQIASELPQIWNSGNYIRKQRLQNMLFPEYYYYNRKTDKCRTPRVNSVFSYMAYLARDTATNKKWNLNTNTKNSHLVAPTGIEPASKV